MAARGHHKLVHKKVQARGKHNEAYFMPVPEDEQRFMDEVTYGMPLDGVAFNLSDVNKLKKEYNHPTRSREESLAICRDMAMRMNRAGKRSRKGAYSLESFGSSSGTHTFQRTPTPRQAAGEDVACDPQMTAVLNKIPTAELGRMFENLTTAASSAPATKPATKPAARPAARSAASGKPRSFPPKVVQEAADDTAKQQQGVSAEEEGASAKGAPAGKEAHVATTEAPQQPQQRPTDKASMAPPEQQLPLSDEEEEPELPPPEKPYDWEQELAQSKGWAGQG